MLFESVLENTIFDAILEEDMQELEDYERFERSVVDSVMETNDIEIDGCDDDDDCDDYYNIDDVDSDDIDDDLLDMDDDDDIDSILDDIENNEIYDQYSTTYRKYY